MERKPFDPPETAMERHIAELVDHLQHGYDNRSGFAAKIEGAMAHAFFLEAEVQQLTEDNHKLEAALAVGLPSITASFTATEFKPASDITSVWWLDWHLDAVQWRAELRAHHQQADEKMWQRMRHITFRQLLKRVREQFEKTFPNDNPCHAKTAHRR